MIIVDGPDGAGKSTLCQMLVQDGIAEKMLPSPRIAAKNGMRMKYETDRYMKLYADKPYVVDRYLFSEMAYGPVLRGRSQFSAREYLEKLMEIRFGKIPVIFCLPKKLNFKPEETQYIKDKMPEVVAKYEEMEQVVKKIIPLYHRYEWDQPEAYDKLKGFLIW